jgi:hypothetical protein
MLPHDLQPTRWPLPMGNRHSAAFVSGERPRHLRLGYLLQQRFPGVLKAWWTIPTRIGDPVSAAIGNPTKLLTLTTSGRDAVRKFKRGELAEVVSIARRWVRRVDVPGRINELGRRGLSFSMGDAVARAEEDMFTSDVVRLRSTSSLHPTPLQSVDDPALIAAIDAIAPYLIVTYGASPLPSPAVTHARGLAIAQDDRYWPASGGRIGTEAALYHRHLEWVGSTVHMLGRTSRQAAIIRRSTATLHPDDSVGHCIGAVSAAGAALTLDVVGQILSGEDLIAFEPAVPGPAMADADIDTQSRAAVARDFAAGWLGDALKSVKEY